MLFWRRVPLELKLCVQPSFEHGNTWSLVQSFNSTKSATFGFSALTSQAPNSIILYHFHIKEFFKYDFYNWFASCKFLTLATVRYKLFYFAGTFLIYPNFLFQIIFYKDQTLCQHAVWHDFSHTKTRFESLKLLDFLLFATSVWEYFVKKSFKF